MTMESRNVRLALADLADPLQFSAPLSLREVSTELLLLALERMLTIRLVEEAVARLIEEGHARCPCHLAIGQEAVAVGVSLNLTEEDRVFGTHRSHAHYLALGGDVYRLIAEILGREEGCAKGMGGSMHIYGPEVGFHGSVPIVGATIPIAAGAALAALMDRKRQGTKESAVAVCYFGDGASEEGVLHETMNLAAKFGWPVIFVCENNLFSSHLDIILRQPFDRVARFAEVHGIEAHTVDGNDVVAVSEAAGILIERARNGKGPGFLEAVTYRWRGHVGPREDVDVGLRRSMDDLSAWKKRDPIKRLSDALVRDGRTTEEGIKAIGERVAFRVADCAKRALEAPYPSKDALLERVYASSNGKKEMAT
ncbi:MAG: pyruvate dehydrogenase E1 component subunit alpha [Nitrospiraceae bacterium]|nr:MAG: pyruvate dehydrogenase E1 component subunit alpha [Nitrospiraceae bacterium]